MTVVDQSWSHCFACGPNEPHGLRIAYRFESPDRLVANLQFDRRFQGFDGIIHGGILVTCLDDAMANLACLKGERAVTVELQSRFRKAVQVEEPVRLEAWVVERSRRLLTAGSTIRSAADEVCAEATGRFLIRP